MYLISPSKRVMDRVSINLSIGRLLRLSQMFLRCEISLEYGHVSVRSLRNRNLTIERIFRRPGLTEIYSTGVDVDVNPMQSRVFTAKKTKIA